MAKLLEGAPVAEALTRQIKEGVDRLRRFGPVPTLAILRVGERPADLSYEKQTRRQCESVGIRVKQFLLPENSPRQELLDAVEAINRDPGIHGCLLFRPLADKDTERAACALLAPEKDVDGVGIGALGAVFAGEGAGFPPCTAQACMEVLDYYQIPIAGKRAAVIGRSLVVGRPAAMLLQQRDATVTICHSKTRDLPGICREADILIAAAGQMGMVTADFLRPGQVVLDVGIHREGGKLRGDVDFPAADAAAEAVTPVPGGVGRVTSAVLTRHVFEAAAGVSLQSQQP